MYNINLKRSVGIVLRNLQKAKRCSGNLVGTMKAWQIDSYGGIENVKLCDARIPTISKSNEVLVKVDASSVNPIDVVMTKGYASKFLNLLRRVQSLSMGFSNTEFPLIMGRDFSGTIVSKGQNVGEKLKLGDEVWGIVPLEKPGCHANYVVVKECMVNRKPKNLSKVEAASILYTGITAWSALWYSGGLFCKSAFSATKRVLVLGGSGGVGTMAIQILRAWGIDVVTTCNGDTIDTLKKLGASVAIDFTEADVDKKVIVEGPYDIVLDCCNQGPDTIRSKGYPHKVYVTLDAPLVKNVDQFGFLTGTMKNVGELLRYNIQSVENKSSVRWGFYMPTSHGLQTLQELVENGKLVPVVEKVYPFSDLPKAYERIKQGNTKGKIVVEMTNEELKST